MADWPAIVRAAAVLRAHDLPDHEERLAQVLHSGAAHDACRAAGVVGDALRTLLARHLDGVAAQTERQDEVWAAVNDLRAARQALAGVACDRVLAAPAPAATSPDGTAAWATALARERAALPAVPALSARPALLDELTASLDPDVRRLLVLGNFKRGKSTLINALLGTRLLPARVTPATAVLCTLRHAHALEITVRFVDGRPPAALTLPELEDHVCLPDPAAGADDPDGALQRFRPEVAAVDIGLPWPLLRSGLQVIDSPGLNEAGDHTGFVHAERTQAALAGADLLIYVLSATEPLSADELDTIEGLWKGGHRTILFVVNYVNRLDEEDLPAVRERFARLLRVYGPPGDALPLFFVAARPALLARERGDTAALAASGLPALHDALGRLAAATETAPLRRARLRRLCAAAHMAEDEAVAMVTRAVGVIARAEEDCRLLAVRAAEAERAHASAAESAAQERATARRRHDERRRAAAAALAAITAALERHSAGRSLGWLSRDMPAWLAAQITAEARRLGGALGHQGRTVSAPPPEALRDRAALLAHYRDEVRRAFAVPEPPTAPGVIHAVQRAAAEVQAARRALAEARRRAADARAEGQRALADAALLDATILRLQAILVGT
jgi:hypothetical protein